MKALPYPIGYNFLLVHEAHAMTGSLPPETLVSVLSSNDIISFLHKKRNAEALQNCKLVCLFRTYNPRQRHVQLCNDLELYFTRITETPHLPQFARAVHFLGPDIDVMTETFRTLVSEMHDDVFNAVEIPLPDHVRCVPDEAFPESDRFDPKPYGFVYMVKTPDTPPDVFKIGCTTNFLRRLRSYPRDTRVLQLIRTYDPFSKETKVLTYLSTRPADFQRYKKTREYMLCNPEVLKDAITNALLLPEYSTDVDPDTGLSFASSELFNFSAWKKSKWQSVIYKQTSEEVAVLSTPEAHANPSDERVPAFVCVSERPLHQIEADRHSPGLTARDHRNLAFEHLKNNLLVYFSRLPVAAMQCVWELAVTDKTFMDRLSQASQVAEATCILLDAPTATDRFSKHGKVNPLIMQMADALILVAKELGLRTLLVPAEISRARWDAAVPNIMRLLSSDVMQVFKCDMGRVKLLDTQYPSRTVQGALNNILFSNCFMKLRVSMDTSQGGKARKQAKINGNVVNVTPVHLELSGLSTEAHQHLLKGLGGF